MPISKQIAAALLLVVSFIIGPAAGQLRDIERLYSQGDREVLVQNVQEEVHRLAATAWKRCRNLWPVFDAGELESRVLLKVLSTHSGTTKQRKACWDLCVGYGPRPSDASPEKSEIRRAAQGEARSFLHLVVLSIVKDMARERRWLERLCSSPEDWQHSVSVEDESSQDLLAVLALETPLRQALVEWIEKFCEDGRERRGRRTRAVDAAITALRAIDVDNRREFKVSPEQCAKTIRKLLELQAWCEVNGHGPIHLPDLHVMGWDVLSRNPVQTPEPETAIPGASIRLAEAARGAKSAEAALHPTAAAIGRFENLARNPGIPGFQG